ncbi:hypothetical protein TNCT_529611 [Trichonephila clavata]|uniref:Uncharacterized protein n=1 Tax=Trichonephila clavata TaxID=2740835 RepID=A0A8X6IMY8_TRICU|nr:hypothetical protein TNCT_529611 [Trichonephila clavata]
MRSLKTFQGIFWLLYQFLFLLDEVKGGAKRDLFDCATVHVCECGLAEEFNKCYLLAPDEACVTPLMGKCVEFGDKCG